MYMTHNRFTNQVITTILTNTTINNLKDQILSEPDPYTGYGGVIVLPKQTQRPKGYLPHLVQSLQHTSHQITTHKHKAQILRVLVFTIPKGFYLTLF